MAAIEQLREHWPQGTLLTLDVIVTNAGDPATDGAVEQLKSDALTIDGLSGPPKVTKSTDGTVYDVALVMSGTQNDPRNHEIVSEVRASVVPPIFGSLAATTCLRDRRCRVDDGPHATSTPTRCRWSLASSCRCRSCCS